MRFFLKGVKVPHRKNTASVSAVRMPSPQNVIIPVSMNIGKPAEPVVKVGDSVCVGTLIAEASSAVSSPVYSSVSGVVTGISDIVLPSGTLSKAIKIESDGKMILTKDGYDRVEFYLSANKGAEAQSLSKIASGGEIARVMLAIKSVIVDKDGVSSVVFDEIDTGVSGRIADAMGDIIAELSSTMQVVNITHLPQVASKGEAHFVVYKENSHTNIKRLSAEERVVEIAKLLSGSEVSEAALTQARNLLGATCA